MAKHGRKRSSQFVTIPFDAERTLLTLADDTVAAIALTGGTFGREFQPVSVDALMILTGLTAGEGPIEVGYAHGDLSVTEIDEQLLAENVDSGDIIANERAKRPVRKAAIFPGIVADEVLNDGKKIRTKLWRGRPISEGQTMNLWVKNVGGAALQTGGIVRLMGNLFGYWK